MLWSEEGKTNERMKTFNMDEKKQLLLRNFALEFQFFFSLTFPWIFKLKSVDIQMRRLLRPLDQLTNDQIVLLVCSVGEKLVWKSTNQSGI
jgi:hypothetical protein